MDHIEQLRRLAIHSQDIDSDLVPASAAQESAPRDDLIARFAALIAVGGTDASFGAIVDEAVRAQVSAAELVRIVMITAPTVGVPRVVAAAQRLIVALGLDEDQAGPVDRFPSA
ncbi:hypothetical protein DY023_13015 [Microbacterium bovistercoris]|uniref:Carboxymuconolactone decarboxylase family protein n=1 Tax=Microbacterium bovistercoris TaxID=2293570 RepID=A0A371NSU1_9MICO|nr:hypothetical protein [Microbacterium bovistercoris]REJ04827.1 hypothetical protein DY023_13015 [Microbacterium bovistercoris]